MTVTIVTMTMATMMIDALSRVRGACRPARVVAP